MKKYILILLLAFSLVFLMACNNNTEDASDKDSTFVEYGVAGNIEAIETLDGQEGIRIHVVGDENNGASYDNAWVTVNEDTVVYLEEEEPYQILEVGHYVHVFFEGPVSESYPVQGTAKQINLVPDAPTKDPNNDSSFLE